MMKNLFAKLPTFSIFVFFIVCAFSASAQIREVRTSTGEDFIFSFMPNNGTPSRLTLFISSDYATSGVVDIPRLGAVIAFTVKPDIVTSIDIPVAMAGLPQGTKSNYGIRVTSNLPISLYGLNQQPQTTDAFLILPVHSLGKNYIAAAYNSINSSTPSYVAIVGVQDNTRITVTSKIATSGVPAGVPRVITLNKMETFLVASSGNNQSDISGTLTESDKYIAVTSGVKCAYVPVGVSACDHLVEMMPPIGAWGNSFITYPLAMRTKGDLIRIMASVDNTEVNINGSPVAALAAGAYYDAILKTSNVIETTKPALVVQYSVGQSYDRVISDPFMMLVPPTEQFLEKYIFSTPASGFTYHFANVVIRTTALATLRLNGVMPDPALFKPIGDGSFSGGQIPLSPGSHSIFAAAPFGLYVYGFGSHDSYGYPGGMSTEVINPINGDYKNVRVISSLHTGDVDLDLSSFVVAPEKIEHRDGVTTIEWFFPEFSIGQIKNLDYEVVAKNLLPGEKRVITSSLNLSYQDLNDVEHTRTLGQQELTVLSSGFTIGVSTDKQAYGANQEVNISTQVANAGPVSGLVSVTLEIRDVNGNYVAGVNTPPAFVLGANDSLTLSPRNFSTGNTYIGNYLVHAVLKDQDGMPVAEDHAAFTIVDSDTAQMSAQVTTDKLVYTHRDTLNIVDQLTSLSENRLIENITVITRVLHEDGEVFWHTSDALAQLTPGAFESLSYAASLTEAGSGNYTVQLTVVSTGGLVLASDQASFQIQDNPVLALSGSVTVAKNELPLGESQSCTYSINNNGFQAITGQIIKLNLVRVDEALSLASIEQQVDLAFQGEKSFTPDLPVPATQGNFACVLEAVVSGQTSVLATALFTVKESPIRLVGDITLGEKTRLLVLMDSSSAERVYLEDLLTEAGWFYTIVDNAAAFATELNQGGYGVYALLSDNTTLDQTTQNLLDMNVAAGDGLIVAGATDRRHQSLEQVLGIKARANEAYAKGIAVQDSELGFAWERSFTQSAGVLNFTANGATIIGQYRSDLPGADTQTKLGPLGAAGRYGNFVWDNFTSLSSTIEGRIAVGGNLSLQNFSVGDKLDPSKLHDVVTVGGNVTFPSGRIYYGNLVAGGSVAGVGDAVRFGIAPGATITGNAAVPTNFTGEREYLQELSNNLANLPTNGTVTMQWGGLELKGDCNSNSQVFNVNGADLAIAHTFAVSCIPAGATVVFNVFGQNVSIKSMGMQSLSVFRDKVLFNFPQATSLSMTSVGIEGSILAPFAQVDQPAGRIDGQVMVKSWYSTNWGYMSIHNRLFGGDLSAAIGPSSKNALSIYQYEQGKSVFIGFDVLAQATAVGVGNDNPLAHLLLSALEHVNPDPIATRAGKTIPLVVTYENTGGQVATGQVMLSLDGNLDVISAGDFNVVANSNHWILPLNLKPGAAQSQLIYVKLPASGNSGIQLQLQTGTAPGWAVRYEKHMDLSR